MKTLDEVIKAMEDGKAQTIGCDSCVCHPDKCQYECELVDALHYLKSYQAKKYMWDEIEKFHPEIKELLEKWRENIG